MDAAINKHFKQGIESRKQLTGGYSFKTWLLTLTSGQKVVFRSNSDFTTGGGRRIIIADIFRREKFFYDNVNKAMGNVCPHVYAIDDTCENYETPYQISEYLEGLPLNLCFESLSLSQKQNVYQQFGELVAGINKIEIEPRHPYITSRGPWEAFFAGRLRERLLALVKNQLISIADIDKIIHNLHNEKAKRTLSFLHLDMRFENMLYNNGHIYLLDAENCEFGDPLFELAALNMNNYTTEPFMEGYLNIFGEEQDFSDNLFYYYQMERCALVLDVYTNEVKDAEAESMPFMALFNKLKKMLSELVEV